MTGARAALRAAAAVALAGALGCASAGAPTATVPACAGLTPPKLLKAGPVNLTPTYVTARVACDVVEEIVVERDGAVRKPRLVAAAIPNLVPFAEVSLERSKFLPASIEGNPVAVRGVITIPVGAVRTVVKQPPHDRLRAFVPGGGSREATWQLAGSVERLTVVAHVGTVAQGAALVAVAPGGAEKTLLAVPAAPAPLEIRETVKTGGFLDPAGDYRLDLRAGGKILASTTVTIAAGFESAIVNACEPIEGPEKTGPGK